MSATLVWLNAKLQRATNLRDPVIASMDLVGDPSPSSQVQGMFITAVRIVFTSNWAKHCAFRARDSLQKDLIQLVHDVPDEYEDLRTQRRKMLSRLPKGSLPATVIGVDFYYIPSRHLPPPPPSTFNEGPWVWVGSSFQALQALVSPPRPPWAPGPGHAHRAPPGGSGPGPSVLPAQQPLVSPSVAEIVAAAVARATAAAADRARRDANQAVSSPAQS